VVTVTSFPSDLQLLGLAPDRLRDLLELDQWAFPSSDSFEDVLKVPCPLSWDRTFGVIDPARPERLLAVHSSYPFGDCPVPGGRLPVAGLTWVGVHPEQRRRGILRTMIEAHFQHCLAWGEPVSLLTASEPAIYGRFGYGLAAHQVNLTIPRGAALRAVTGSDEIEVRVEHCTAQRHRDLVSRLHAAIDRPGWVTRETPELVNIWMHESPIFHPGFESGRILVAERGGEEVGYALFRRKSSWGAAGPEGTVKVSEVVGLDAATTHALWTRLLDFDLTTEVTTNALALDDPLLSMLLDIRAARPVMHDNVWVRVLDVAQALSGRRYAADVDVVLEVSDDLVPANTGRWRLSAAAFGHATVERTDDEPDLSLDIRELGAAYLGGIRLSQLADSGLVGVHSAAALDRATAAFGWTQLPVASWVF